MTGKGRGFVRSRKGILALVLTVALLAGCGQPAAEMVSIPATPAPTPEVSQTQVLRSIDGQSYYTQTTCYDLKTMTACDWRPELPAGYQMTGEGPVSDGQALYFLMSREGDLTGQALGRMPLEGGDVQILYKCGEREQIGIAYTDGAGEDCKRPVLLRSGERRCFLVHRWTGEEGNSTWLYGWDLESGVCEPVKQLGSHVRFWGEYQGRAVLEDSREPEAGLFQLDADTGELTVLLSGENTEAAELFLGPPLLIRENFVCMGTMFADNPDGKERVYCLDLKTGAIRQLASSDDGYLLIRMQDIWDGKLRVRGTEGYESGLWYVDCVTGQRVEGALADESGIPLHIRAQIGEYYLIDVPSEQMAEYLWLNENGEPVYSRDIGRKLALIAKEDYWAGQPDYQTFEREARETE
ncbi:hypothetical protein EDD77_10948 [Allofournierella massiliensis]|uniref:WG repeat protein n=1 Tax=Allofournierella massiliensis TaxID=1650663 RepID=A0A4R1QY78_9FIRM|nr:hypothetical protein EDD77_10948 [Fournierella massiliensis]